MPTSLGKRQSDTPIYRSLRHDNPEGPFFSLNPFTAAKGKFNTAVGLHTIRHSFTSVCLRIGAVLADDHLRRRKIWLSYRDFVYLVASSLDSNVSYGIYNGVSANAGCFLSIENVWLEIGNAPGDNAFALTIG